jgi:hypothetical protein
MVLSLLLTLSFSLQSVEEALASGEVEVDEQGEVYQVGLPLRRPPMGWADFGGADQVRICFIIIIIIFITISVIIISVVAACSASPWPVPWLCCAGRVGFCANRSSW